MKRKLKRSSAYSFLWFVFNLLTSFDFGSSTELWLTANCIQPQLIQCTASKIAPELKSGPEARLRMYTYQIF